MVVPNIIDHGYDKIYDDGARPLASVSREMLCSFQDYLAF